MTLFQKTVLSLLLLALAACGTSSQTTVAPTPTPENPAPTARSTALPFFPSPSATARGEETAVPEPILIAQYSIPGELLTIYDLYFLDQDDGWGVGDVMNYDQGTQTISCCKPSILHTTDGGKTWTEVDASIASASLESITFTDRMHGYIVGIDYTGTWKALILRTADGGKTWFRADTSNLYGVLNSVMFTGRGDGWSVGVDLETSNSLMLHTLDGITWAVVNHPSQVGAELSAITFPTGNVGYAVGFVGHDSADPLLLKTVDGGQTWTELPAPYVAGRLLDVLFLDEDSGYAVGHHGDYGTIIKTQDGGTTWTMDYIEGDEIDLEWIYASNDDLIVVGNGCPSERKYVCEGSVWVSVGADWQETLNLSSETITAAYQSGFDGSLRLSTSLEIPSRDEQPNATFLETNFYHYLIPTQAK